MASITIDPDTEHAFDFERNDQHLIGHVEFLKIGTTTLVKDITLIKPVGFVDSVVIGALDKFEWSGNQGDPITLDLVVSPDNRGTVAGLVYSDLANTDVQFSVTAWDYDSRAKRFFMALGATSCKGKLRLKEKKKADGSLSETDDAGVAIAGELNLSIESAPHKDIDPPVHLLKMVIHPGSTISTLNFAAAHLSKVVKKWGVPPPS